MTTPKTTENGRKTSQVSVDTPEATLARIVDGIASCSSPVRWTLSTISTSTRAICAGTMTAMCRLVVIASEAATRTPPSVASVAGQSEVQAAREQPADAEGPGEPGPLRPVQERRGASATIHNGPNSSIAWTRRLVSTMRVTIGRSRPRSTTVRYVAAIWARSGWCSPAWCNRSSRKREMSTIDMASGGRVAK